MKHRPTVIAIIMILMVVLFGLFGCKELKEMKASLVEFEDVKSLGAYENKVLMMFILKPDGKDFFINVFNFNNSEYLCMGVELPEENQAGTKYFAYLSTFFNAHWMEQGGLGVNYPPYGGETKYVSKKKFFEGAKPFIDKILEQKKPLLDAMREAAIDNGILKVKGVSV